MAFDIVDSSGQAWRFSITDAGQLTSTRVAIGSQQSVVIADYWSKFNDYRLGATIQGLITTTFLGTQGPYPNRVQLVSSGGSIWYLIVTNTGILQSMGGPTNAPPVIGQVLGDGPSYPTPLQPGGIGTPVTMPTQQDGEKTGRFRFGCGHSFNTMEVRKQQNGAVQSAFLTCPICGYIARIITPYSDIFAFGNEILQA